MEVALAPEIRHEFVQTKGLRFHVATCGEGDRLALCLHGFPETWYSWRHQLPLLARLGYRAWAPDLRGYGETDRPAEMREYAMERLVEDVGDLIDAAAPSETLLVAHDWGAIIAWFAAMRRVRPLDRLVIMNVPHPGPALARRRGFEQARRSWYILFFQIPWLPEAFIRSRGGRGIARALVRTSRPGTFSEADLAVYAENARRPGVAKAMCDYYRALVRGGGMRRQQALGFPVIDTPTLMLWGEDDVALTKGLTYGTDRFVSDLTLRYLPGVSHWVQQDAPETVNAMLEAWLRGDEVPEAPPDPR